MATNFVYWRPLSTSFEYMSTEAAMLRLHEQVVVSVTYETGIFSVLIWPQKTNYGTTENSVSYDP